MTLDGKESLEAYVLTVPGRQPRTGIFQRVLYWDEGLIRTGTVTWRGPPYDPKKVRVQWDYWLLLSDEGRIVGKRKCGIDPSTVLKKNLGSAPGWLYRALWNSIPNVR